ncbi:hypothetical protein PA25_14600 [Pseudoalteromonas sp. A25]|uniref:SUMF1/EgtB/PvdO family nonheme iron enzyme n=1 Tax=Pseudoalteromonas sp. A25 TaxID=116092 RepID=UPI00129FDE99|nr:SUMF1/EgtB/PvdO family nonheme iron enzyme [Pseudoalteromonas sp. A25]BBN81475.1 hypothetical protein PA25_14600 [Pseudoalteromonas sp. A25]
MNNKTLPIIMGIWCGQALAGGKAAFFEPPTANIPAGSFMAKDHTNNERYKVNMVPFQMAKYELTVAEFRKFVEDTGYQVPTTCNHKIGPRWFGTGEKDGTWNNNFFNLSEYHPVVCIGVKGAEDYAAWLSKKTGKRYQLMSEAQWLYVMRTGGYEEYVSEQGKKRHQVCEIANLADRHAKAMTQKIYQAPYTPIYKIEDCTDREILSATVGLYKADKYGVHDLLGNIQEVVADCYADGKQRFVQGGAAVSAQNCTSRIAKGSSWHWEVPDLDKRVEMPEDFLAAIEGFRLVIDTQGKEQPAQSGSVEFVTGLSKAQQQVKIVHAQIADYPHQVKALTIKDKGTEVVLNWQESTANLGVTYKVLRQDLLTNSEQVIAHGISSNQYIDQEPVKNKARYKVFAQFGEREGLVSNTVDSNVQHVHVLPARIQGEAFSQGEKVTVHNSIFEPKQDSIYVNVRNTRADYRISVSKAGKYTLQPRVFHDGSALSFRLYLNDQLLKEISTSGESGWQTPNKVLVTLPKGQHTLSVQPLGERTQLSLNWIDLKKL